MENQTTDLTADAALRNHPQIGIINSFCEFTGCQSKSEALFFLESHGFNLDAAVSTFLDDGPSGEHRGSPVGLTHSINSPTQSIDPVHSHSPRSRSPSPPPASRPYGLRSSSALPSTGASRSAGRGPSRGGAGAGGRGIRTLADLGKSPKDSDPDFDPQEYYTGGEKSGMLVQGPSNAQDVDAIFNQARQSGAIDATPEHLLSSSSRSFAGNSRLLSGDVPSNPQPPEAVRHSITFWRNGFTVDDGPLRRLDDPANASFLESISKSECPRELAPADRRTQVHVNLVRREEDYKEPEKPRLLFQGVGRTLGSTNDTAAVATMESTTPLPSPGLIVDQTQPTTSIQLRLADGTRMVSRFNNTHTIRDIRIFIDASRPNGPRSYQLQVMGFPPKQLSDLDQTIDEAGISNSVVIQKL